LKNTPVDPESKETQVDARKLQFVYENNPASIYQEERESTGKERIEMKGTGIVGSKHGGGGGEISGQGGIY
jgi:hypothetical protein